ncbi:SIS domain-containing protein [Mesorhizobium sp. CAU 1732]|uniref:D-sedoheptulose-7-phosphate isomerase n=1 Tax=Mesorhizobium sp. CAU 1732 TaxID=3140358 RepID=UPI003261B38B
MSFLDALQRHNELFRQVDALETVANAMADDIETAIRKGGKVVFFGNGGSAADSQHLAAEFVVRYRMPRQPLPALALTVDTSILTAQANDYEFASVFSRQVLALCSERDVIIGISTSGNSANVIEGIAAGCEIGAACWGWTGEKSGKIGELTPKLLQVPATETARIQEVHLFVGHWICEEMDRRFATS